MKRRALGGRLYYKLFFVYTFETKTHNFNVALRLYELVLLGLKINSKKRMLVVNSMFHIITFSILYFTFFCFSIFSDLVEQSTRREGKIIITK